MQKQSFLNKLSFYSSILQTYWIVANFWPRALDQFNKLSLNMANYSEISIFFSNFTITFEQHLFRSWIQYEFRGILNDFDEFLFNLDLSLTEEIDKTTDT